MKRIFIVGLVCVAGCSFKVNGNQAGDGEKDMAVHVGGTPDLGGDANSDLMSIGGEDAAPTVTDMMPGADLGPVCVAGSKLCASNSTKLETCRADGSGYDSVTCAYECATTGVGPHCRVFTPSAPVITDDFGYTGLTAISYSSPGNYVFDTATGTITGPTGVLRGANAVATTAEVVTTNGAAIGFRRTTSAAVWAFASLSTAAGVNIIFVDSADAAASNTPPNQYAAAFASMGAVSIAGTIDVRGYDTTQVPPALCNSTTPGPGGGVGGASPTSAAGGSGFGIAGSGVTIGGNGGSYGGVGGTGGGSTTDGKAVYGNLTLQPLLGGSGGGAGGSSVALSIAPGGGGGGAFEMVSKSSIIVTGTINAGGCEGNPTAKGTGAGGGGSGGAILLEAGTITLTGATVSANGGGAGGAGQTMPNPGSGVEGDPGAGLTAAKGGAGGGVGGAGGNGGAAGSLTGKAGGAGGAMSAGPPPNGVGGGGGGGGAAGRIRLNTTNGTATGTAGALSPAVTDTTTCSVGMLNLQ